MKNLKIFYPGYRDICKTRGPTMDWKYTLRMIVKVANIKYLLSKDIRG